MMKSSRPFPTPRKRLRHRSMMLTLALALLVAVGWGAISFASPGDAVDAHTDYLQWLLDTHMQCNQAPACIWDTPDCPVYPGPTPDPTPPSYPTPSHPPVGDCNPYEGFKGYVVTVTVDCQSDITGLLQKICGNYLIVVEDTPRDTVRTLIPVAKVCYITKVTPKP